MSAVVKVLIEGYTNADLIAENGEEKNCPTISLIREENFVMLVDPGVLKNQQILIDALLKENLTINDIDIVSITHSHIDHYRNIGMFPSSKVLEYFGVWDKDTVHSWPEQFSPNVQVLRTPGHSRTDITLFVTTNDGVIAICGDVFWKENYPKDPADDPFAIDLKELKNSRELVLKMADFIIPGHGKMYEVNQQDILNPKSRTNIIDRRIKKNVSICKRCRNPMEQGDKCLCRPWLCYKCCECGLDCDLCSCSHKRQRSKKHKRFRFLNFYK